MKIFRKGWDKFETCAGKVAFELDFNEMEIELISIEA